MHYQDHLAKFSILRPLKSKRADEVAYQLTNIFLLLGAPHILQSDNGREFTANIITELKLLWPELKLVHGRPRHPQSQGSVERANADIKSMIISWTHENNNTHWSEGLRFFQFKKKPDRIIEQSINHHTVHYSVVIRKLACPRQPFQKKYWTHLKPRRT